MLLAEDLLLLLLHDASGKPMVDTTRLDLALAGAALLELATLGKVDVTGPHDAVKPGRLIVRDGTPTGDTVLDEALRKAVEAVTAATAGAIAAATAAAGAAG